MYTMKCTSMKITNLMLTDNCLFIEEEKYICISVNMLEKKGQVSMQNFILFFFFFF